MPSSLLVLIDLLSSNSIKNLSRVFRSFLLHHSFSHSLICDDLFFEKCLLCESNLQLDDGLVVDYSLSWLAVIDEEMVGHYVKSLSFLYVVLEQTIFKEWC
jgi:hypothetical protein